MLDCEPRVRAVVFLALFAWSALILQLLGAGTAGAQVNPARDEFSKEAIEARRQERQQAREELSQRYKEEYRLDSPLISPEVVASMQSAIMRYESIAASGGWGEIPYGVTLHLDETNEHVGALRRRFELTGDISPNSEAPAWTFDASMRDAVARYQMRNGLRVTGFVDQPTRRALNVPVDVRLRQLRQNLVRLEKLLSKTKDGRYVLVNAPGFFLQTVEDGRLALYSRVVIGRPSRQTPEMTARIQALDFYPTWRVPDSVARQDLIPKLRIDPATLEREHFEVLPGWGKKPVAPASIDWQTADAKKYKFRQAPGPWNALGLLRINMPNKDIVYLHDSPFRTLYSEVAPAYSSGCVRVQRIGELAAWLVQDLQGWDAQKVDEALQSGESKTIKLRKPVPVRFVYVTAWATADGLVHFRPDIYRRDGGGDAGETDQVAGADALTP